MEEPLLRNGHERVFWRLGQPAEIPLKPKALRGGEKERRRKIAREREWRVSVAVITFQAIFKYPG